METFLFLRKTTMNIVLRVIFDVLFHKDQFPYKKNAQINNFLEIIIPDKARNKFKGVCTTESLHELLHISHVYYNI